MEAEDPWRVAFKSLYEKVDHLVNTIEMYATASTTSEALEAMRTLQLYSENLDKYMEELLNTAFFDEWKLKILGG